MVRLILLAIAVVIGCGDNSSLRKDLPLQPLEKGEVIYKAPKDICGEIVFEEKIADEFQQALDELLRRKTVQGFENVVLDPRQLQIVTDVEGNPVDKTLFVVIVRDKYSGLKVHAWHEVIDNDGNLYIIDWCPD